MQSGAALDEDKITLFEYNGDDQLTRLTAQNPETGDQVTEYLYGTTAGTLMDLSTGHFLREIYYPDKDPTLSTDRVLFYRNRQGEVNRRVDQHKLADNDTAAHDYTYDGLGRVLHDAVTYLDAAKDGTVRRISYAYTPKGQLASVQSWSHQTPGSGTLVNEVQFHHSPGRFQSAPPWPVLKRRVTPHIRVRAFVVQPPPAAPSVSNSAFWIAYARQSR